MSLGGLLLFIYRWGYVSTLLVVWSGTSQPWCSMPDFSKMETSRGAHSSQYYWYLCLQCSVPIASYSFPLLSQGNLQDPQVGLTQILMDSLLCPWTQCTWNPVCTHQECSLCLPQSFGALHTSHWSSMTKFPGAHPPNARGRLPDMGFRILTLMGEPLWYSYFPVCRLLTQWVWDCYILKALLLSSQCGLFFVFRYSITFLLFPVYFILLFSS